MQATRYELRRIWHSIKDSPVRAPIPADPHAAIAATMPEVPRLVYRLHDVEGLCIKEIASALAKRPSWVRQALARARLLLRASYGSSTDEHVRA